MAQSQRPRPLNGETAFPGSSPKSEGVLPPGRDRVTKSMTAVGTNWKALGLEGSLGKEQLQPEPSTAEGRASSSVPSFSCHVHGDVRKVCWVAELSEKRKSVMV